MPPDDDPTDQRAAHPWAEATTDPPDTAIHLVIAWLRDAPTRAGQVTDIDRKVWLGRGKGDDATQVQFATQRPGSTTPADAITTTAISRRQLEFARADDGKVRVTSVGRRELRHNGVPTEQCTVRAGDTLTLENTAVFLVDDRPRELPRTAAGATFEFGAPDAHGQGGESPCAWRLRDELTRVGSSGEHVLVRGESGVGKELAAHAIHALSPRSHRPFVARNAATIPASLLDAELFGNAANYPNPGLPARAGLVGSADGGSLFLDEVGELPEEQQAHLLRVLDEGGEYHRLGESDARRSDFRLIAATNRPIDALKHDFRARFSALVQVPGLNERRSDIPLLARELLRQAAERSPDLLDRFYDDQSPTRARIDPTLLDRLLRHRYTLHTRELGRILSTALRTSPGAYLTLTSEVLADLESEDGEGGAETLGTDSVVHALREANGNITRAAEKLGITRHALRRLMKKLDIAADA